MAMYGLYIGYGYVWAMYGLYIGLGYFMASEKVENQ